MQESTFEFTSAQDGATIFCYKWLPDSTEQIRGCIQIAHGMAEHAGRYQRLAKELTAQGYAVYANDHRGHGKTGQHVQQMGHFSDKNGWSLVVDDMHTLNGIMRAAHPEQPAILLGHSMGSFLSQTYLIKHSDTLAACILSATAGDVGFIRKVGLVITKIAQWRVGLRGTSPVIDLMGFGSFNKAFKPNRTEYDWLSRDDAEVDVYINDPLCGFSCTCTLWADLLTALGENAEPAAQQKIKSTLPIYILTGLADSSNKGLEGTAKLGRAYQAAGMTTVDIKGYPDGRHEMFNETNRAEVTQDMLQWLANTVK